MGFGWIYQVTKQIAPNGLAFRSLGQDCSYNVARKSVRQLPYSHGHQAMSWSRQFDDPIPLRRGDALVTLRDAAEYIAALPKREHDAAEWQDAMEALLLVVRSGPTMLARIAVLRALNRDRPARR